jgi:hypothetical protein
MLLSLKYLGVVVRLLEVFNNKLLQFRTTSLVDQASPLICITLQMNDGINCELQIHLNVTHDRKSIT